MRYTPHLLALALVSPLCLMPLASAAPNAPGAQKICAALTQSAKNSGKKNDAKAKARLALAAAIKKLEKAPEEVNARSKGKGITPLMVATALGEKDAIRWLISIGADPTIKDAAGKDSLSRAKDDATSALLKKGGIFTWKEALAYLESINPKDWAQIPDGASSWVLKEYAEGGMLSRRSMLGTCRKLAAAPNPIAYELYNFLTNCALSGHFKLLPFLFHECEKRDFIGENKITPVVRFEDWQYFLPDRLWLPLFRAFADRGYEIDFGHPSYNEVLTTDKKLAKWMSNYAGWEEAILYGASSGSLLMVTCGADEAKQQKVPPDKLQSALNEALKRSADHDGREYENGKPDNPHYLQVAKYLMDTSAKPIDTNVLMNCREEAKSAAMIKLFETAAAK